MVGAGDSEVRRGKEERGELRGGRQTKTVQLGIVHRKEGEVVRVVRVRCNDLWGEWILTRASDVNESRNGAASANMSMGREPGEPPNGGQSR